MVQWSRLHTPKAGDLGSIPGQGIFHMLHGVSPQPPQKWSTCLRKERPTEIICADWGIMSVMAINKIKTGDVAARVLQRNGNWAYMSR